MSVFHNNMLVGASQPSGVRFDTTLIGNSIWLEGAETSGDAATRTWGTESNQDRWIWATWFQPLRLADATATRSNIFASGTASGGFYLRHNSTASTFNIFHRDNAGTEGAINTTESYRDLPSWIHLLVDYDSANNRPHDRISLFINGVRTGVNSGNRPGQNNHLNTNVSGQTARIGQDLSTTPNYHVKGYLAQTVFLDNKSIMNGDLDITDFLDTFTFGTNGSQIIPKSNTDIIALASAAGNNSFCLDYSDASNIVNDASSKGNNFSTSTIASANQSISTPSKTYSVFNPLAHADNSYPGTFTLSDGNQKNVINSSNTSVKTTVPFIMSGSNIIRTQFTFTTAGHGGCGITSSRHTAGTYHTNADSIAGDGEVALLQNGALVIDGNFNNSYFGGLSNGDVVDVIVNCDVGAVYFAVNGTLLSSATQSEIQAGTTTNAALVSSFVRRKAGQVFNFYAVQFNPTSTTIEYNSGQSSFTHSYSDISSLISLNTADSPAPDFQGIDFFDTTLYEGTGGGLRVGDFVPFTDAYTVTNSAMFQHDDVRNLSRTIEAPSSTGGKKGTWSAWFKTALIDTDNVIFDNGATATNRFSLNMDASGQLIFSHKAVTILKTNGNFKADGAWYNVVLKVDTSLATAADRAAMFVDGVEITGFEEDRRDNSDFTQNDEIGFMDEGATQFVGSFNNSSANQWDGYLAELVFLDDQFLDASSFGQLDTSTNRWVAKNVSGLTFGNSGFYLEFKIAPGTGNGAGTDTSGNSNHFTSNGGWATTDQSNDAPSNNIAIFDGTDTIGSATPALSEGNTKFTGADNGGRYISGFPLTTGKFYWELDVATTGSSFYPGFFTPAGVAFSSSTPWNNNAGSFLIAPSAGHWLGTNGSGTANITSNYTAFISSGDRMFFAYDADNKFAYVGEVGSGGSGSALNYYSLGGAVTGDPTSGAAGVGAAPFGLQMTGEQTFYFGIVSGGAAIVANLIADPTKFNGTPPTGYVALTQDNMDATSDKITSWSWIKNRDSTDDHVLVDRIRGVEKVWESNTNTTAFTNANTVQRFLQRGVQIGNDVTVNTVNESYVHWQWLMGSSATTGSTTSPAGTIASTTIVADAGHFSVGSYTGTGDDNATVGHGLGGIPELIIVRNLSRTTFGLVWHTNGGGATHTADFAVTATFSANSQKFGGSDETNPTANVFKIGTHNEINADNESFVFYAFRSIPGVCKIGSYEGNNNADGPYISTGFKVAATFTKPIDSTGAWMILDNKREPNNPVIKRLFPSANSAEDEDGEQMDFYADGFKLRKSGGHNGAGTYIYLAMADIGGNGTLPPIYGR